MDDPVAWLRQQLDEDEGIAKAATAGPWRWVDPGGRTKQALVAGPYPWQMIAPIAQGDAFPSKFDAEHIARHDPARVLRDVEAKRRILDVLEDQRRRVEQNSQKFVEAMRSPRGSPADELLPGIKTHGWTLGGRVEALEETAKLLALPYSDRPEYREEWKP